MKAWCDRGNSAFVMRGCRNVRARKVERIYLDGSSVITHECEDHADDHTHVEHRLRIAVSTPLKRAA